MLEATESLLPLSPSGQPLRCLCVGEELESLHELERLLTTLGASFDEPFVVTLRKIHPGTYIGQGKLDEIKTLLDMGKAEAVVFDFELSPNQLRNIEKYLGGKPVLDRPGVILEIFSRHARTKESKTQVELARLQYLYPRLAHYWSHFERQRGGGGGGGGASRGMGEKQIEVDRRLVKGRITILRNRLKEIEKERQVQRASRKDVLKVAIVGYTNAGKSTLLNALTQSEVLAEDKLFATLDASVRSLDPHGHPPIVAIDTVGFIRKLPHSLVASFRSTLEELHQADLLLHVVDASSPIAQEEIAVTEEVLKELGLSEKPRMLVLNKSDRLGTPAERNRARVIAPGAIFVSALDRDEVAKLREVVLERFRQGLELWEVVVPYSEGKIEAQLFAHGSVETTRHLEKGTYFRVRIAEGWARKLDLARFRL